MKNKELDLYINTLFNKLEEVQEDGISAMEELYNQTAEIQNICSLGEFSEKLEEEVRIKSEEKLIDLKSPVISESDLFDCYNTVTAQIIIDSLVEDGFLEKQFDLEKLENTYKSKKDE